jgi:glycosyltransferase involved in cell wall biosynthesis
MNIAIEAFALSSDKPTGIGNVIASYLQELKKIDRNNYYYVYTIDGLSHVNLNHNRWSHIQYNYWIKRKKYDVMKAWELTHDIKIKKMRTIMKMYYLRLIKMFFEFIDRTCLYFWIAQSLRKNNIDVFIGTFADFFPLYFFSHLKRIWLIHDIVWQLYPETTNINGFLKKRIIVRNLRRADLLLSVSESTRNDIMRLMKYGIIKKYILSVCTLEPRKNLNVLLEAYAMMAHRDRYQLVLAGMSGWKNTELLGTMEAHPGKKNIIITGYVPSEDLAPLYSGAGVFVFPTLYEGFGLPVLEAMQCGCPVISSTSSSIPEVAGDACILLDPHDVMGIRDAIEKTLTDEKLSNSMRNKGLARSKLFSWEGSARRLLDIIQS